METELIVAGAAGLGLLVIIAALALGRRRAGKADKLDAAFERAKYARRTGTMGSDRGYIR